MVMAGKGPNRSTTVVRIAAPVGVVSSISTVDSASGTPLRISAVAGAGKAMRPWAALIQPFPGGTGLASNRSTPSRSRPTAEPTMSMIESTAPTSWKWILDRSTPWTRASASPSRMKIRLARSFCGRVEAALVDDRLDMVPVPVGVLVQGHEPGPGSPGSRPF